MGALSLQLLGLLFQSLGLAVGIVPVLICLSHAGVIVALSLVLGILAVVYSLVIITLGLSQSLIRQIQISDRPIRSSHSFLGFALDPGLFQGQLQLFYLCLFFFYRFLEILGIILYQYISGLYLSACFCRA